MSGPNIESDRLDLRSHDLVEEKREELLRLFPEVRTEDGQIDFDRLKLALGEAVEVGKERYALNWPGKADCFKTIQAPSLGTLLPCPVELRSERGTALHPSVADGLARRTGKLA